ncbi:uncharacterized protein LOC102620283 [Citrus sinensis]|uniref:uncharacterized protein LOC112096183 n=1 Tax=Citrus clementina TaxID=85681 RepID=UPI0003D76DA6|nr:uncharacterized protein LOC112096183 [Citrus x clementina]XP_024035042.1 uncharacterized protein LOC112096183 [Citrus x clementina]XP_024035043.1 uncharacterized protein LOC112096183 [Citrus x clementina]XP_024035044.1 uncharacterized protein LOC112096183 [Citrus x clementina]XP_052299412.1 uncharacterized protein LOC102620283 [Citrus sinensis]
MGRGSNNSGGLHGGSTVYRRLGSAQQLFYNLSTSRFYSGFYNPLPLQSYVPEAAPYNIPQPYSVKHLDSAVEDDDCLLSCAAFFKASPSFYKFVLKRYFQ